ncbi:MAG: hypothetical protein HZC02_02095 [Candidatus Levybacteria bacterium]|nr:hypothetical protein [Candidatus Levybacteria bacterium]
MIIKTAQKGSLVAKIQTGAIVTSLALSVLGTATYTGLVDQISAQASTARSITITPPSLPFTVNPGEKKEGVLGLINESNDDIVFSVVIYDMIVEDNQGTPEFLPAGTISSNKYAASSWIGVDSPSLLVKAHSRGTLHYYVQVPADAGPGGHYAGIVYHPERVEIAKGSGAAINQQLATLVYFDVAGPVKESAQVKQFSAPGFSEYGPVKLTTEISNFGDTHIKPTGTLTVTDMLGKVVASKKIQEQNIFPGGISRLFEESVGKKWMLGKYEAKLMATYGRNNNLPLVASVAFWVFPWKIALLIITLIVAAILGYLYVKKNKHTPQ